MSDNDRDRMIFEGEVVSSCKGLFTVKIDENYSVLCTLSGKIKQQEIKIIVSDHVTVEVSPYDTARGRITYRMKNG
jgi:translation initiation factor IF-1